MFENSQRYSEGQKAAYYLTAVLTPMSAAERADVGPGVIRVLLLLAAMRASGAQVSAADMASTDVMHRATIDTHLAEAKRQGWVTASKGKLHVTSTGRQVVADVNRGWERAARKLVAFSSALPFRKRAARRQDDQA